MADDIESWLKKNWDPDLTVREWWEKLGLAGWSAPNLPIDSFGKGYSREETVHVQNAIAAHGALGAPGGLGLLLAAPTIAVHGTKDQKEEYIRDIVCGKKAWCQLFSEPGAGSDLAGLTTRAVLDGEEWVINGQKVWTSGGQIADLGMLLARSDPEVPKHQGITYFAIEMDQEGIEVRPLREMTGRAIFNEVFLTDAKIPKGNDIGGLGEGWKVANSTLSFERAGLGAGGGSQAGGLALPGTKALDLDKRAGDFLTGSVRGEPGPSMIAQTTGMLIELAKSNGKVNSPLVRQALAELHTLNEIARYTNLRQKALKVSGLDVPGIGNIAKLSMSDILRKTRDLGLELLGPRGTVHAYDKDARKVLDEVVPNAFATIITELSLFAQGPSIYGGTDEIQHNIIGERVLGLPKEPNNDKTMPFSSLPKNA